MDLNINLSKNFTLGEFIRSHTASKLGIDNSPTEEVVSNLKYLCEKCLQPMRDRLGLPIRVNSGYRSPNLNKAIGGSPASFHSFGCAADIEFTPAVKGHKLIEIFDFFYHSGIYTELIAESLPDGWIHIAIKKGREKENQLKYMINKQGVKRGTYAEIIKLVG